MFDNNNLFNNSNLFTSPSMNSNPSIINSVNPMEAIEFIVNHEKYNEYLAYLETWKEELGEDTLYRVEKISNMFNLGLVGNGDRRLCGYYEDYVIKMPIESCYKESNEKENDLFNFLKDKSDLVDLLCPILCYKDDLIVTPLCEELEMDEDEFYKMLEDILFKFECIGVKFTDLEAQHQFGVLNGKIVILDYEDYEFIDL